MTNEPMKRFCVSPDEFIETYDKQLCDTNELNNLIKQLMYIRLQYLHKTCLDRESVVGTTITHTGCCLEIVNIVMKSTSNLEQEIGMNLSDLNNGRVLLEAKLAELHCAETRRQYTRVVTRIDKLNYELRKEFLCNEFEKSATTFANLCEIGRILQDSKASNLRAHLKEVLLYWHEALKEKFAREFQDLMRSLKWPFVNANFSVVTPAHVYVLKMQIIGEYLLQIDIPEEFQSPMLDHGLLAEFPRLCLPIQYLVEPFSRRFAYHFYGTRQTNRIDKPEWYFTQILSWIRDHVEFVGKWIQPVVDRLGLHHIDVKLELMSGLVCLAVEKLNSELPNLRYDDYTFSHSVDEALSFDKELRETFSYSAAQPSILIVLTQGPIFNQWLKMEKKYAFEKMDSMFNDLSTAFEPLASEEQDFKITVCADTFITLLQTITERYESLPQPGHRLQFLDLQRELLDNFRIRLLQLIQLQLNSHDLINSLIAAIANTLFYIENVLFDWGSMLHYLNLYYYKMQLSSAEKAPDDEKTRKPNKESKTETDVGHDTVFSSTLVLYSHIQEDLIRKLSTSVMQETKVKAYAYRHERWISMINHKELREFSLTPTACPMFEVLARRLHQLEKALAKKLFTIVWRIIASELDDFLHEDLVLENRFNDGGANQFKYDVHRNLFALFSQYCEQPQNYFPKLKDSCNLLNMSKGSAILLRETLIALETATGLEDRRQIALKEIGVTSFTPQQVVQILNHRADLTS